MSLFLSTMFLLCIVVCVLSVGRLCFFSHSFQGLLLSNAAGCEQRTNRPDHSRVIALKESNVGASLRTLPTGIRFARRPIEVHARSPYTVWNGTVRCWKRRKCVRHIESSLGGMTDAVHRSLPDIWIHVQESETLSYS
jgi:hypothetical protein